MSFQPLDSFNLSDNDKLKSVFSTSPTSLTQNNLNYNENQNHQLTNNIWNSSLNSSKQTKYDDITLNLDQIREKPLVHLEDENLNILNKLVDDLLLVNTENTAPPMKYTHSIPTAKIARIVVATCSNLDFLINIVQSTINPADITMQRMILNEIKEVLVFGWYDLRHIPAHLEYLQNVGTTYQIFDLSFSYITDDITLNQITTIYKFNFFENVFDVLYLCMQVPDNVLIDHATFQNDIFSYLLKFGTPYEIKLIDQKRACYKCRFYNIRTPFLIKNLNKIKINNCKVNIFQTLIELNDFLKEMTPVDANTLNSWISTIEDFNLERKKYQFLKHRRLGSIPFKNNEIKNENRIDISRILSGKDERVTLLIKNIPNKVRHDDLKQLVDQTSFGEYDFLCK